MLLVGVGYINHCSPPLLLDLHTALRMLLANSATATNFWLVFLDYSGLVASALAGGGKGVKEPTH